MTPNFALNLSEDGIALLHRAPNGAGWFREGRVDFATDNIAEGLAKLRAKAIELGGEGFETKLVLPASQLLFTSVDKGADVGLALSQRTPYRADQLIYDTSEDGDKLRVVAVALETLGEAEGFITPHKLNPVGFTAIPAPHQFKGEPMLGGTLMGADSFETDIQAVKIIEKPNFLPSPVAPVETPAAAPAPKPELTTPPPAAKSAPQPEAKPAPEPESAPVQKPVQKQVQKPADPVVKAEAPAKPSVTPEPAPPVSVKPEAAKPPLAAPPKVDAAPKPERAAEPVVSAAPKPAPTPPEQVAPTEPVKPPVAKPDGTPAAFSSRRSDDDPDAVEETGKRIKRRSPRIVTRILLPEEMTPKLGAAPSKAETAPPPVKAAPAPAPKPTHKPAPVVPPSAPTRKEPPQLPAAVAKQLAKADPIAQLAAKQQRGKPRFLGLILTAILLVCLGLAAVISSYILPDNAVSRMFGLGGPEPEIVLSDDQTDPELIEGIEAELSVEQEIELARLPTEDTTPGFAEPTVEQTPAAEEPAPPRPEAITEDEARAAYAATGIWQYSDTLEPGRSAAENLDGLYVASLDPNPVFEDAPALSLPPPGGGEAELVAFTPPPPPGVIFDIDERGLVRPTPEGSVNPFGIMIFQGPPPVAAVPRPGGTIVPEATPQADATPAEIEENRLSGIRPVERPGDLVETQERANLGGLSRPELALLRPLQRPASQQAQAEAIARALAEAEADSPEGTELAVVAATAQAVPVSRRAAARPSNFATTVANARRAPAAPAPESAAVQTASASTASAAGRATGPSVARSSRATPTGPVSTSVARAATDNNALALGKVSLVGVFGTSSSRRALVRMPNGRFKKLSVGDRIDGGRVAAISGSSLRYTKSGRSVTLNMPQS